jgi:ABC-type nitrate/sulfonate/bicarbonate transport system permease component
LPLYFLGAANGIIVAIAVGYVLMFEEIIDRLFKILAT